VAGFACVIVELMICELGIISSIEVAMNYKKTPRDDYVALVFWLGLAVAFIY
jgi:hypothetical protein